MVFSCHSYSGWYNNPRTMKFYIVTPTFNALGWLQRCVRSVADQVAEGVQVHHHVQDGASKDGSADWLREWQAAHANTPGYVFTFESSKDAGMYDAINLAWSKMPSDADVTAHLNSDEQYLPGALKGVAEAFLSHPEADVALGTYIIVDAESRYICHRRPIMPHKWTSRTVCEIITCSCFHRAEPFVRHNIRFDTRWRAIADVAFYRDLVNDSPRFLVLPELITGTFTVTGSNLAWTETSRREWAELCSVLPWYVSKRHGFAYRWCNLKRRLRDFFCTSPRSYALFMPGEEQRTSISIKHPTPHWGCRVQGES